MPKLIVADENEGRRNLLANTLERAGYEVTRAGTLRQAEGTALATMPEVVLIDGEWKISDAIDASQRLMTDPEFAFKCRIVILSRNTSSDYLTAAARAGVSEVISKPVDMNKLLAQLEKHSKKQFVPPPAEVANAAGTGGGGTFDVSMVMSDGKWALPMLKGIVTPEKINVDFINEILAQLGEEGIEVEEGLDPSLMSNMLELLSTASLATWIQMNPIKHLRGSHYQLQRRVLRWAPNQEARRLAVHQWRKYSKTKQME